MTLRLILSALLTASLSAMLPAAAQVPAAITTDPTHATTNPAAFETFQIPSHGALLNALSMFRKLPSSSLFSMKPTSC